MLCTCASVPGQIVVNSKSQPVKSLCGEVSRRLDLADCLGLWGAGPKTRVTQGDTQLDIFSLAFIP